MYCSPEVFTFWDSYFMYSYWALHYLWSWFQSAVQDLQITIWDPFRDQLSLDLVSLSLRFSKSSNDWVVDCLAHFSNAELPFFPRLQEIHPFPKSHLKSVLVLSIFLSFSLSFSMVRSVSPADFLATFCIDCHWVKLEKRLLSAHHLFFQYLSSISLRALFSSSNFRLFACKLSELVSALKKLVWL